MGSVLTTVKNAVNSQPRVHGLQEVEVVRSVDSQPWGLKALGGPGVLQILPFGRNKSQALPRLARGR